MKLLAFSDLHRDTDRAERLVELAGDADVVAVGDYATMRPGLKRTIETLSAILLPTVLVPGNAESNTELRRACAVWPSADVLHGQAKEILGTQFFGLGAECHRHSFDLGEDETAAKLETRQERAVLVVHSPPKGYVDEAHGPHLGSTSMLEAIERKQPAPAVCGHIHRCWGGEATIDTTPVVNARSAGSAARDLRQSLADRRAGPEPPGLTQAPAGVGESDDHFCGNARSPRTIPLATRERSD